jgi:hypothetical protein
MNTLFRTYRFTRKTRDEIDALAGWLMRSRNSLLVYLVHQAYLKEAKKRNLKP